MTDDVAVRERPDAAPADGAERTCRGWVLVAAIWRLPPDERRAAEAHLRLCRRCRQRLDAESGRARVVAAGEAATVGGGVVGLVTRLFADSAVGPAP